MITIDELRGERRAVCLAKTLLELRDALITARDGLREYNDRLCYTRSHHEVKIDEWIDLRVENIWRGRAQGHGGNMVMGR